MKSLLRELLYALCFGAIVLIITQDRSLAVLATVIVAALYRYD